MLPTSIPTVVFGDLDKFAAQFKIEKEILSGVASVGDPAAYALVWEWGNIWQTKPGPKTVEGTNPDGKTVWLSSQAPTGYIRMNEAKYWKAIEAELKSVNWNQPSAIAMTRELEKAAYRASQRITKIIQQYVPVDSGDLRDSLRAVKPGDDLLQEEVEEYETMMLEESDE